MEMSPDQKWREAMLGMNEDELMRYSLSGEVGGYIMTMGETALRMKVALRMLEANNKLEPVSKMVLWQPEEKKEGCVGAESRETEGDLAI